MTNVERWEYIRAERAKTPPTLYRVLARELGLHISRVTQLAHQEHPPARGPLSEFEPGKEYGFLTFLGLDSPPPGTKSRHRHGRFRCRCGTECVLPITFVRTGNNTSCGCRSKSQALRSRDFGRVCAICRRPFKGAANARICKGVECRRKAAEANERRRAARVAAELEKRRQIVQARATAQPPASE